MLVDDFYEVDFVENLLEDSMPFPVMLSSEAHKSLQKDGKLETSDSTMLEVHKQTYSGDAGGFLCWLRKEGEQEGDIVISLTHLIILKNHPHHRDLTRYQKRRIKSLKREQAFRPQIFANDG